MEINERRAWSSRRHFYLSLHCSNHLTDTDRKDYTVHIPHRGILEILMEQHEHTKVVLNRIARACGHLNAIKKMVEDGRDCSEILIQLSAVKAEIANTSKVILKDHLDHCVVTAVQENDEETIRLLKTAIDQLL